MKRFIFKTIFKRVLSSNSKFYSDLQKWGLYILGVIVLLYMSTIWIKAIPQNIDVYIQEGCKWTAGILLGIIGTAQTGTTDSSLVSADTKDQILKDAQS